MHRSRKILIVCHCLLNANAKIYPLANCGGVYRNIIDSPINEGVGIVQLPCPETVYLGMNRWGMTKEQYDTPYFRDCCRQMLQVSVVQIKAFAEAGYKIESVVGMDGSPNCGINRTCYGFKGGEIGVKGIVESQREKLEFRNGKGVFMEILSDMLQEEQLDIPFTAIDEEDSVE